MAPLRVIIAGGGIGGLMLALMLERAHIDYIVLERSAEHRPLGSAIALNGTVLRVFEQLGLLEEIYRISKFSGRIHLLKEDLAVQGQVDLEHFKERYGYYSVVFGRPDLFEILVARIPSERLIMGKRILSVTHTGIEVMVRCSDNSIYHGDILVGADGAYSAVRQCMHRELKNLGMLPRADSEPLKFDQNCVVGITNPLPEDKFPALKEKICELYGIMGNKKPYTIWLVPINGNRLAWSICGRLLDSEVGREDVRSFSFAEWWPEHATEICDQVREFTLPDFTKIPTSSIRYTECPNGDESSANDIASISDSSSYNSPAPSLGSASAEDDHSMSSKSNSNSGNGHYLSPHSKTLHRTAASTLSSASSESNSASSSAKLPFSPLPKRVRTTIPGTVGEIIDATPEERVSKVMLESKLFKAWSYDRTVLIGDACHKLLPFAGQGAVQAILDGVSLANALYEIESNTIESITKAFKKYTDERQPMAKGAVSGSQSFGKVLNIQGKLSDFLRRISFNHVPNWILKFAADKLHLYRPQLSYLPMVPDYGTAKAYTQKYSPRYLRRLEREREERENRAQVEATEAQEQLQKIFSHGDSEATPTRPNIEMEKATPEPRPLPRSTHSPRPSGAPSQQSFTTVSTTLTTESHSMGSERSSVPPPLPSQGPPQYHPNVYLQYHPEDKVRTAPIHPVNSSSSSNHTSPASSSYSLVTPAHMASDEIYLAAMSSKSVRARRQSHGNGLASSAHHHLSSRGVASPVAPPPPMPLSTPLVLEAPLRSPTFKKPGHNRTKSQHAHPPGHHDEVEHLYENAANVPERVLSQQRSLEQLRSDVMSLSVMGSFDD
ncbi:hypothetical protein CPC16_003889 [Podila verticillata]|nr:hypothetical protein BGZ52_007602 [Haplosporangium bisporale]KAF9391801.1 hypothetical protein CPC16_003889 [Podila verticillata]KFH64128.1 hypothetical protein MVEG_09953 [Podila verticillata NRRL 6337]